MISDEQPWCHQVIGKNNPSWSGPPSESALFHVHRESRSTPHVNKFPNQMVTAIPETTMGPGYSCIAYTQHNSLQNLTGAISMKNKHELARPIFCQPCFLLHPEAASLIVEWYLKRFSSSMYRQIWLKIFKRDFTRQTICFWILLWVINWVTMPVFVKTLYLWILTVIFMVKSWRVHTVES